MALGDIDDPNYILSAIAECDKMGTDAFLSHYGFKNARDYFLLYEGRRYPSKAIVGVAHKYAHPSGKALKYTDFTGGLQQTIPLLEDLGFAWLGPGKDLPAGDKAPSRSVITGSRIIRDTSVARAVKKLHDHACQVCGQRLLLPGGPYAEGAHIRPLGQPHNGPDEPSNVLSLCPNCHVLFDSGAIGISKRWQIIGTVRELNGRELSRVGAHYLDKLHLKYHRERVLKSKV